MKWYRCFLIILFFLLLRQIGYAGEGESREIEPKQIIIIIDALDFTTIKKMDNHNDYAMGILNNKTDAFYKSLNKESLFMTLALGRRVKVSKASFAGLEKLQKGGLKVKDYKTIEEELYDRYPGFSREISTFGEYFKERGKVIGYIGNDASSLIAVDRGGMIPFGENQVVYDGTWLNEKTKGLLNKVDILIISYEIEGKEERMLQLEAFLRGINRHWVTLLPRTITGDVDTTWNTSLVPVLYQTPQRSSGVLKSDTTRRQGVITNLDIFPNTVYLLGEETSAFVGSRFVIEASEYPLEEIKKNFKIVLNLNILKYLFHGAVIILQLLVIFNIILKEGKRRGYHVFTMESILMGIFLSFVLGLLDWGESIFIYFLILLLLAPLMTLMVRKIGMNPIKFSATAVHITLLYGIFVNNEILYNSIMGYNNIVAGGRFYGVNNEVMGVLLASSIITLFSMKGYSKSKVIKVLLLLVYPFILVVAFSSSFGANLGGLLAGVSLWLILIYRMISKKKIDKKAIAFLVGVGLLVVCISIYLDFSSVYKSHTAKLLIRMDVLGYKALFPLLLAKIKQFLSMLIIPPWSLIWTAQLYFIRYTFKYKVNLRILMQEQFNKIEPYGILFAVSSLVFLVNDTGVIAFTYMNTYLISKVIRLYKIGKR